MASFYDNSKHLKECFMRETLEQWMQAYGVRNIARMELFLWDLELFLHIQEIFKDRIVLKGGAAVQFYLPIGYQRTSVDIDMIFCGAKEDIDSAINQIEQVLGADEKFFRFRQYIPESPKTELPLYTYFVNVPSVCNESELRGMRFNRESIKIEFITYPCDFEINRVRKHELFAADSDNEYNILPINHLFADKLTTLGPNTIGIAVNISPVFSITPATSCPMMTGGMRLPMLPSIPWTSLPQIAHF